MSSTPFRHAGLATVASVILAMAACASAPPLVPPNVPESLRAPAGQALFLETSATGVQIYECAARADQPAAFEWTFRAPEATLADRLGRVVGKHYGGPTWESISDGSSVVGDLKARDAGPDPTAIPWLLLAAKSTTGSGLFAQTKSVQRVHTLGGVAPPSACGAGNLKQVVRVPYTATYYFYRAAA